MKKVLSIIVMVLCAIASLFVIGLVVVLIRVSSLAVNIVFAILANGIYKKCIDKLVNEMP